MAGVVPKTFKERLLADSYLPGDDCEAIYYITPGDTKSGDIIQNAMRMAMQDTVNFPKKLKARVKFLKSRDEAIKGKLCRIGDHPFQFYSTWMSTKDYKLIWEHHPDAKRDGKVLPLPYPPFEHFCELRRILDRPFKVEPQTRTGLCYNELGSTEGKPETFPSVWKKKLGQSFVPPAVFEKLHLIADGFGGQNTLENAIIGTRECNRHMLRAEHAIDMVLRKRPGAKGTLVVTNEWKTVQNGIPRIKNSGLWYFDVPPEWPLKDDTKDYMWLCVCLKYQWTMMDSDGLSLNSYIYFDPFSCYTPLRVEALVDIALGDRLDELSSFTVGSPTPADFGRIRLADNPRRDVAEPAPSTESSPEDQEDPDGPFQEPRRRNRTSAVSNKELPWKQTTQFMAASTSKKK